jgi:hypothetical protein
MLRAYTKRLCHAITLAHHAGRIVIPQPMSVTKGAGVMGDRDSVAQ